MSQIVADCPRCSASKTTFDLGSAVLREVDGWQHRFEVFAECRHCTQPTLLRLVQHAPGLGVNNQFSFLKHPGTVAHLFDVAGFVSQKDLDGVRPPEHLPASILAAFEEGPNARQLVATTRQRRCSDFALTGRPKTCYLQPQSQGSMRTCVGSSRFGSRGSSTTGSYLKAFANSRRVSGRMGTTARTTAR